MVELTPDARCAPSQDVVARMIEGELIIVCLLYTSDAADERSSVDLGGRRIIKKKTNSALTEHNLHHTHTTHHTYPSP